MQILAERLNTAGRFRHSHGLERRRLVAVEGLVHHSLDWTQPISYVIRSNSVGLLPFDVKITCNKVKKKSLVCRERGPECGIVLETVFAAFGRNALHV